MISPVLLHPSQFTDVDLEQRIRTDERFKSVKGADFERIKQELSFATRYSKHSGPFAIASLRDLARIFPSGADIITNIDESGEPLLSEIISRDGKPEYGVTNESETFLLYFVTKALQPGTIVDFGTFYGRSALILAEESPSTSKVITIDLPEEERKQGNTPSSVDRLYTQLDFIKVGEKYRNSDSRHKIRPIYHNVTSRDFPDKLDEALQDKGIDLAVIDAAHQYGTVRRIFEDLVMPRLSNGGVAFFDDVGKIWSHNGTTKLILDKALIEGYLIYGFLPAKMKAVDKSGAFFINLPEAKYNRWREAGKLS